MIVVIGDVSGFVWVRHKNKWREKEAHNKFTAAN